ncbi:Vacuolar protein sorting-associated protein 26A [Perkinsus olseni]|uniref:Vacuolar protein sorting-associated protein 26A n=2 Tax=Perkinsus olseni TaxID=32597 RepID=A0A7J6NV55_PEROL|nr:Vacuolar protein sorting-associated protein 26A [Perkinsus olseni]KAF4743485.1 Vacuolar protein sorting-associated protein 26A [Perkinsus olseni]
MALLASSLLSNVFGAPCELDLQIDAEPGRKKAPVTRDKKGELGYIFTDGEDVCGTATVRLKGDKRLEHQGIRVELIGQVDMLYDRSSSYDFFSIAKDLEPPGVLTETRSYKWK